MSSRPSSSRPSKRLRHEFVHFVPERLEPHVVYVSIEYKTVVHLCACGCGEEVVTPINPAGWRLLFDGDTVSLEPSIGNWSYRCRSHYWIENDKVVWALPMSDEEIEWGRRLDSIARERYYRQAARPAANNNDEPSADD